MEPSFDIDLIVQKHVRGGYLSPEETARLNEWLAGGDDRVALVERLRNDPEWVETQVARLQNIDTESIWSKIEIPKKAATILSPIPPSLHFRRRWWTYAAVASIVLVTCTGGAWLWLTRHRSNADITPATQTTAATEIKPGGNKAVLTLADGSKIDLGNSTIGVLANQENSKVSKVADGQLAYKATGERSEAMAYNVLSTPKAGQWLLHLPDGTNVWINNASVIRYPVAFTGPDRVVELSGEAYFEVAKDPAHPFKVKIQDGATVDVLGTSFNIMSYSDEPAERTTLVDGSVRVTLNNQSVLLKPDQQSDLGTDHKLNVNSDVNVQSVIAWKDGYFSFDQANIKAVIRQLARWYDLDVEYRGQVEDTEFQGQGRIQRNLPLTAILKGLESEHLHFKLDGQNLIITP